MPPRYLCLLLLLLLSACSIPPSADDTTGFRTIEIVDRIRCEARTSIQQETLALLIEDEVKNKNLIDYLRDNDSHWLTKNIRRNLSTDIQKSFYLRYIESSLVMDFTFDLSESNKNSTEIDLLKALSRGTVGLNFVASDEHKRGSRQQFLISETFGHLLDDQQVCFAPEYDLTRRTKNYGLPHPFAPITGAIGIRDIVKLFIQINREGILDKNKDVAAPTLADTLMFTATYIGSINPVVAINPIGRTFDFKLASLTGQATRSDINQVVIGLSLDPKVNRTTVLDRAFRSALPLAGGIGADAFARKLIKPSERRAIDAVTQQKIDTFYDRFILLR